MDAKSLVGNAEVVFGKGSPDKYELIENLLDVAFNTGKIRDRDAALKSVIEREQYLSTGFENGLAVPHAKTDAVEDPCVVLGIYPDGVQFDSLDEKPAHFIFLLVSPITIREKHIQTLALLARNFKVGNSGEKLLSAGENESEIRNILQSFE